MLESSKGLAVLLGHPSCQRSNLLHLLLTVLSVRTKHLGGVASQVALG